MGKEFILGGHGLTAKHGIYLLTYWEESNEGNQRMTRIFQFEQPQTGQKLLFSSLEDLCRYLQTELDSSLNQRKDDGASPWHP